MKSFSFLSSACFRKSYCKNVVLCSFVYFLTIFCANLFFASNSVAADNSLSSRIIDFHSDQSLGSLYLFPEAKVDDRSKVLLKKNLGAAVGKMTVTVPSNMMLGLEPNRRLLDNPERMNSMNPDSLDLLCISASSMDDTENDRCNKAVRYANHFKLLKELIVDRSDVNDQGLMQLKNLNSLNSISAMLCFIDGSCFKSLSNLPALKILNLWGTQVTSEHYKDLPSIKSLVYLNVNQTKLTADKVRQIAKCSNLKKLFFAYDATMVSAFAQYLLPLKKLEVLDLRQTSVDDAALPELAKLKSLKNLDLRRTGVTTTGLLALKPLNLDVLRLSDRSYSPTQLKQIHSVCKSAILLPDAAKTIDKDTLRTFAPVTRRGE